MAYYYLSSHSPFGHYQIILLDVCEQLVQRRYIIVERRKVEATTSLDRILREKT